MIDQTRADQTAEDPLGDLIRRPGWQFRRGEHVGAASGRNVETGDVEPGGKGSGRITSGEQEVGCVEPAPAPLAPSDPSNSRLWQTYSPLIRLYEPIIDHASASTAARQRAQVDIGERCA